MPIDPLESAALEKFRVDPTYRSLVLMMLNMLRDKYNGVDFAMAAALAGSMNSIPGFAERAVVTT